METAMNNSNQSAGAPGELLAPEQTARRTHLSVATLAKMRCCGNGPPYFKVGKFVRYDSNDVDAWLRSRRYTSTSQESAA
jgi:predicted DNA-binding transcriptional regulator AlpA